MVRELPRTTRFLRGFSCLDGERKLFELPPNDLELKRKERAESLKKYNLLLEK